MASGGNGLIYITTNGGLTWSGSMASAAAHQQTAVACVSTSTCWMTGTDNNGPGSGNIYRTTNGGSTWSAQVSGTPWLYGITCASATTCFAVGTGGAILATIDGSSWSGQTSGTSVQLQGVSCASTTRCWAVGGSGTILATTDGGATWTAQTSGTANQLNGIACLGTSVCWAVGAGGTIVATNNGGSTWSSQTSGTTNQLNAVSCLTGACWAVGAAGTIVTTSAPANTQPPVISGTPRDGQTLTTTNGSWSGSAPIAYAYQWQDCDSNGNNCSNIAGATSQSYVLTSSDVGHTIRAVVTASNFSGSNSASSAQTGVVLANPVSNTQKPKVSGTAQDGHTLSTDNGTWTGTPPITYTYQWQRCDSTGANCQNIAGATSQTYTLTSADVGSTIRSQVTATNSAGSAGAGSNQTAVVAAAPPANTGVPSISGTTTDGQTLTTTNGSWSGTPPLTYAYQWRDCDANGANCQDIAGATGQTYTLGHSDVGSTIRVVVTATNSAGSASASSNQTAVVAAAPPTSAATPSIAGTTTDGQTLTTTNGSWSGTPPFSYAYQWQDCDSHGSNCSNILGATSQTYTLGHSDVGSTIRVTVTASNAAGSASSSSGSVGPIRPVPPSNTSPPTLSGSATEGSTLTTTSGAWAGGTPMSFAYGWLRCDPTGGNCVPIPVQTASSYTLRLADVGSTIRSSVWASNLGGQANAVSAPTSPVMPDPQSAASELQALGNGLIQSLLQSASQTAFACTVPMIDHGQPQVAPFSPAGTTQHFGPVQGGGQCSGSLTTVNVSLSGTEILYGCSTSSSPAYLSGDLVGIDQSGTQLWSHRVGISIFPYTSSPNPNAQAPGRIQLDSGQQGSVNVYQPASSGFDPCTYVNPAQPLHMDISFG